MLCMSPLFLGCLVDHFWVLFASFPFAIQILQKTLQQPHGTDPGTTPPVCELHCILDKEAASPRVKAKDTGLYH